MVVVSDASSRPKENRGSRLVRCSVWITSHLEDAAERWGYLVASHPLKVIVGVLVVSCVFGVGLIRFREEKHPDRNWIPAQSEYMRDSEWIAREFPEDARSQLVIVAADNVLDPDVLSQMVVLHHRITQISVDETFPNGTEFTVKWEYLCATPVYGIRTNFSDFLGSIWRDPESGGILGAHAALMHYVTVEQSDDGTAATSNAGTVGSTLSHPINLAWEAKLVDVVQDFQFRGEVRAYVQATRRYARVDDMFVILQCWNTLREKPSTALPARIGKTMRDAGVAVTVTSLTDFAAFAIGATTMILSCCGLVSIVLAVFVSVSFCSAIGLPYSPIHNILPILLQGLGVDDMFVILQCWNTLREKPSTALPARIGKTMRDAGVAVTVTSVTDFAAFAIGATTVIVILLSLGLLAVNLFGLFHLKQEFELTWFVPSNSYISKFFIAHRRYFPDSGLIGHAYFGSSNSKSLSENFPALVNASNRLKECGLLLHLESWPLELHSWNENYFYGEDLLNQTMSAGKFRQRLSRFLSSPTGAKYQQDFHFENPLECGEDLPPFTSFRLNFHMRIPQSSQEKIFMMDTLRNIIDSCGYHGTHLAWSVYFAGWETDRFIETELWSNMGLAMLCVLLVTIVLIAHPGAAFSVLAMVCLTLVDVAGTMYLWGLTIEIVTSLNLILAVGLCVDYSAHMAHSFMIQRHSLRQERAEAAVNAIGPAVLKGGLSTMLSFMFLALSVSYVFDVFFKVFLLTCLYGLFNGLVLLPVLLSLCGPEPFDLPRAGSERPRENAVIRDTAENFSSVLLQARQPNGIQASEVETHFISGVPGSANGDAVSSV
ncbi:unnamed protein product [Cyprideis torosa]|uniref:Uncharacterized protein n=1 Tax=Cyprideis torosa TaxID=163714 RepID=A0A7R8ZQE4_9CRUS|nr:unnamed protein product [Cyprideis torosa]CAG0891879.1 unnamed protein product [Cyprideis torosa]